MHSSPEDSLTCCAWHYQGQKFYVGGLRGQFYECVSLHMISHMISGLVEGELSYLYVCIMFNS